MTSSSLTTASVTPPDSVKATSNVDQIPGNSTDTWQNLDDTFWQGLTAQIDVFEASGGNPDLPHLPPYPRTGSSTVAVLNSPSSPTTPLPSSSELPADTFPEASTQLPNESRSSPTSVPQSSPTSPSTTLSPMPILSRPHGVSQPGLLSTPRDLPTQSPATAASLIPPSITTAGQRRQSQPAALECAHPRRTSRVCIPSSRNVTANSIGENLPTNTGKRRGVVVETGVSCHKKRSVDSIF